MIIAFIVFWAVGYPLYAHLKPKAGQVEFSSPTTVRYV